MVGMVWVLIRDWLPTTLWQRIILASVVAALLGSFVVIANENRDFRILQPAEANIAMFISILGFAGGATAGLDHLLDRHLPNEPGLSFLYGGLSALGALVALPLLVGAFFTTGLCDCEQPPSIAGAFLVVASVATITGWSRYFGALPALSRLQPSALHWRCRGSGCLAIWRPLFVSRERGNSLGFMPDYIVVTPQRWPEPVTGRPLVGAWVYQIATTLPA